MKHDSRKVFYRIEKDTSGIVFEEEEEEEAVIDSEERVKITISFCNNAELRILTEKAKKNGSVSSKNSRFNAGRGKSLTANPTLSPSPV